MKLDFLKKQIARIAAENPEGFTFNPLFGTFPTKGYIVATLDTQDCMGKAGLFKVIKYILIHPNCCIGGWKNEEGCLQFDASMVYMTKEEAVFAAIKNKQRAIFSLYTGKEIMANEYHDYCEDAA